MPHTSLVSAGVDATRGSQDGSEADKGDKAVTVLDGWMKAQLQLRSGMSMREIVRQEFEDIFPGDVEQVGARTQVHKRF